ncbi:MAG: heavy metal translocating P-type ATPase [Desulfobulbus sp.]|jgi:heavy metal translocating P-type ATPase
MQSASVTIAHELDRRIRLRSPLLRRREVDPVVFEAGLDALPGVRMTRVNTRAGSVVIEYDGLTSTRNAIFAYMHQAQKRVWEGKGTSRVLQSSLTLVARGLVVGSLLFVPKLIAAPVSLIFSLPVLLNGLRTLWFRGLKVEVLDGAAVLFCLVRRDYFTAASIVFLLSIGDYLEELSQDRASALLKRLLRPQVDSVWVEVDGRELEIPIDQARIGDRVVFGAGELVALDGVVVDGEASVNTASVTGESVPVHVRPGDAVASGTVVENGRLVLRATHVGLDTSMARMAAFLEQSLSSKSVSQMESDRLADQLVPVTFGLGLGLLALTRDLRKAAAVLTVDYSCVIELANPVTIRVAMFTAARRGVLLKGAQALDSLAAVDTLVLDKTGTLTLGQLSVTDVHGWDGMEDDELLRLAAAAEEHYTHPVAAAVVQAARERGLDLPEINQVDFIVAHGVSAYVGGENILVGSRHFIEEDEQVDCTPADELVHRLQEEGKSLLYVARSGQLAGVIGLRDELRPEADAVLSALKRSGIRHIVILSGDAERTVRALAARLRAVDETYWELKPEDKAELVGKMQQEGRKVAFIGDGVNDTPALVSAEVGVCMPGGADLAKDSAQVILLHDDLTALLTGRLIALRARTTLRHSFAAAVGLNSTFLLLATLGRLQPMAAALLHNLSTVSILGYAGLRSRKAPADKTIGQETRLSRLSAGEELP